MRSALLDPKKIGTKNKTLRFGRFHKILSKFQFNFSLRSRRKSKILTHGVLNGNCHITIASVSLSLSFSPFLFLCFFSSHFLCLHVSPLRKKYAAYMLRVPYAQSTYIFISYVATHGSHPCSSYVCISYVTCLMSYEGIARTKM